MLGVIGLLWIFEQDARLQLRPVLFPDPGEFESLLPCHRDQMFSIATATCARHSVLRSCIGNLPGFVYPEFARRSGSSTPQPALQSDRQTASHPHPRSRRLTN